MRIINSVVIHCADTPDDKDFTASDIEEWHRQRAEKEPWSWYTDMNGQTKYIGYHYVVRRNGSVENGRPENKIGCHCKGFNRESIGVVWVGRNKMEEHQRIALVQAVAQICINHGLQSMDVYGHFQFSPNKTCPNFSSENTFLSMEEFRREVDAAIRLIK